MRTCIKMQENKENKWIYLQSSERGVRLKDVEHGKIEAFKKIYIYIFAAVGKKCFLDAVV